MSYSNEKAVAIDAVRRAVQLCQMVQADSIQTSSLEKGDRSPVTVADFGAQALICQQLAEEFPHDPIVGEENSGELKNPEAAHYLKQVTGYVQRFHPDADSAVVCEWIDRGGHDVADRFWAVDPIDGTKGFLRREQYAIALALIEDGQVRVGVLGCPAMPRNFEHPHQDIGMLFTAVHGEGATMMGLKSSTAMPIHVVAEGTHVHLRFVQSVESAHGNAALQQHIAKSVGITQPALKIDSQAKYGAVARGDAALYLRFPSTRSPDYREKIWDHAAGVLIVEEAGGHVTDMLGHPLDFTSDYRMVKNQGVVASNGAIHEAVLRAVSEV